MSEVLWRTITYYSGQLHTMLTLVEARKHGDMETALSCYEKEASIVFGPGKIGVGAASPA
jgi:hypothetical protein